MLISLNDATVRHLDKTLFESLNFQISLGEQWAFIGPSGAGKTALLHTIYGHFNVIKGSRRYPDFKRFKKENKITDPLFTNSQLMAFMPQQAHFRNKENMRSFFYQQRYHSHFSEEAATVQTYLHQKEEEIVGNEKKPIKFSLEWVITHLKLEELLHKTLIQLSNGETRRLMIADALLKQPILLLMDNPFIGLDKETRPILNAIFTKIIATDTAIVMATSSREIPDCITHVALLEQQKIKNSGTRNKMQNEIELLAKQSKSTSAWEPDPKILAKIRKLKPVQDHDFSIALKMEDINVRSSKKPILKAVNWQVNKGEKWSLVGPNGAGKSTLLSLLNGDHPQAYSNTIYLFDKKRGTGESIWELKRRMGYVSPEMHQYFKGNFQIADVIISGFDDTMGFRKRKVDLKQNELVEAWLTLLKLSHLKDKFYRDISSGEQRLVLLIRALIKNPPLLILDEPCQGLDEQQRAHFKQVVDQLWSRDDKTLLYVSHYKEDIPSCVNHLIELRNGEVVN